MTLRRPLLSPAAAVAALLSLACGGRGPDQPTPGSPPAGVLEGSGSHAVDHGAPTAERAVGVMGTLATFEVWAADRRAALAASEAALRALEHAESRLSTWREGTDLARVNAAPAGSAVRVDPETAADLRRAAELAAATGRAFDPGVGALVAAWGLRGGDDAPDRAPGAERLAALLPAARIELAVVSDGATGTPTVARADARLVLEEGAFGKGAGLERAATALVEAGVRRARVDLGGQVLLVGEGPFDVDVADPRDRMRAALRLALPAGSLATSANSERGRVLAGRAVGHVLDPRSGRPAHAADPRLAAASASVFAPAALDADALSTALFVLGPEDGLALAERLPDVEAVFLVPVDAAEPGSGLELRATSGLSERVRWHAPDVHPSR